MTSGPHDEESVRRMLAAVGQERPVPPPEVVDRLDEVLTGLVAARSTTAPVLRLPPARPRRWPQLLAAAGVVGVVALGVGNILGSGEMAAMESADEAGGDSDEEIAAPEVAADRTQSSVHAGLPRLRAESLTEDAQRLVDSGHLRRVAREGTGNASRHCSRPPAAKGELVVAVRLDRRPATLLLRADDDGFRRAEVYDCTDPSSVVASTQVRAR